MRPHAARKESEGNERWTSIRSPWRARSADCRRTGSFPCCSAPSLRRSTPRAWSCPARSTSCSPTTRAFRRSTSRCAASTCRPMCSASPCSPSPPANTRPRRTATRAAAPCRSAICAFPSSARSRRRRSSATALSARSTTSPSIPCCICSATTIWTKAP